MSLSGTLIDLLKLSKAVSSSCTHTITYLSLQYVVLLSLLTCQKCDCLQVCKFLTAHGEMKQYVYTLGLLNYQCSYWSWQQLSFSILSACMYLQTIFSRLRLQTDKSIYKGYSMKRLFTLSQSILSNSECLCTSQPAIHLTTTDLPQYAPIPIHCNSPRGVYITRYLEFGVWTVISPQCLHHCRPWHLVCNSLCLWLVLFS